MTTIRPAGGPLPPPAIENLTPVASSTSASGPSPIAPAAPREATGAASAQSVIADMQAARISPDEAVRQLTSIAVRGAGCPESLRPAVEARIRATIARDPLVGSLLRRMGAHVTEE